MRESAVEKIINKHQKVSKDLIGLCLEIQEVSDIIIASLKNKGKIILFGNGGSAADAQHISAELSGKFYNQSRSGLPSIALTTNTSALTAIGNDFGYEHIFSRQLEGLATSKDVVVGISTSGQSPNIVEGISKANDIGCTTISFIGKNRGLLSEISDYSLRVPSSDTPRIQEHHILIGHIICELVEKALFD